MKKILFFVVSMLISASLVQPLYAQCYGAGELSRVLAGPCAERVFRQAYAPVDYALGQVNQYGHGYYSRGRTSAVATGAIIGMSTGAGLGAAIGGNTRSALIGAGVGAVGGGLISHLATSSYHGGGHPSFGADKNGEGLEIINQTRFPIEVFLINEKGKSKRIGWVASGESIYVGGPKNDRNRFTGFARIPNSRGGVSFDEVPILPTTNGWVFVEPDYGQGRR